MALIEADGQSATFGAAFGTLGSATGSSAFFYIRQWLTKEKDLPDLLVALAEDALAIGTGRQLIQQTRTVSRMDVLMLKLESGGEGRPDSRC